MTGDQAIEIGGIGNQYAGFMQEAKLRLVAIDEAIGLVTTAAPDKAHLHAEFAFLQLRFVCELIALGALWAHRVQGVSKSLEGEYHPDKIFRVLEGINDKSFPVAVDLQQTPRGWHAEPKNPAVMTRADLGRIYGQCGDALHRGVLKHFIKGEPKNYDLIVADAAARKLRALLQQHMVFVVDAGAAIVLVFQGDNDPVQAITIQAEGEFIVTDWPQGL